MNVDRYSDPIFKPRPNRGGRAGQAGQDGATCLDSLRGAVGVPGLLGRRRAAALALLASKAYFTSLVPTPHDLRVLGQGQWLPDSEAAVHVRLVDHVTAAPVPGVPVVVELVGRVGPARSWRTSQPAPTAAPAPVPRPRLARRRLPVAGHGPRRPGDRAVDAPGQAQALLAADAQHRQAGLPARPGDPLRALALRRPDLKPVAGQACAFTVTDPKGNVIFRDAGLTSAFGIGSADCPLAGELIEGPYQVECRVGDTTSRPTVEVKTLRPAQVQGRRRARPAVLPAGPGRPGHGAGRLLLRQARRRRRRAVEARGDRTSGRRRSRRSS